MKSIPLLLKLLFRNSFFEAVTSQRWSKIPCCCLFPTLYSVIDHLVRRLRVFMTIGILKVFLLYNRIGRVKLSLFWKRLARPAFCELQRLKWWKERVFGRFLVTLPNTDHAYVTSQKHIQVKIFQSRFILNFLSLLALIIYKLGLVDKRNWEST